ncbi:MAG: glycine--tRNA ligase subunit beta [Bacteroidota bacterium]
MPAPLLVELLTEELPPRSLKSLGDAFATNLLLELQRERLVSDRSSAHAFATPRRLAALIGGVRERAPDAERDVQGPPVGAPAQAVAGFARKNGVALESLRTARTAKGEVYVAHVVTGGRPLDEVLAARVDSALKALPVARLMRWGDGEAQFVRPVHGLVMLHGARVVPGSVLGISSTGTTHGHRFMALGPIALNSADEYEARLRDDGMVIADFGARRAEIERQLRAAAQARGASLGEFEDLLDEVTALVEHPSVYRGTFDAAYLEVPQECLILTMRKNQKYFPLFGAGGRLLPEFLIVSNMRLADPHNIVGGNQRVVRPRLDDARFFLSQDAKLRLEARVPQLASVVYHRKLGSELERTERLQLLAGAIARSLGADVATAERAAWLSKADLLTEMVGEFPELQGVMGRYYARRDGEPERICDAIGSHYQPRFAGDALPTEPAACAVALADKLHTLAAMFGIGEVPTGEKDPFGLRRAALGVIRIIVENRLPLALHTLVREAFAVFQGKVGDAHTDLETFIFDRFSGYLKDLGFSTLQVDAVLSQRPVQIALVPRQLEAVKAFQGLPEAGSLAAANKRVANILRQAATKGESYSKADRGALRDAAEIALFDVLAETSKTANDLFERGDYTGYLRSFAVLKAPVDEFFDKVMVMIEDGALRRNRLALLADLRVAMNRVAEISRLAE